MRCSTKPHLFAHSRNLELNPLRLTKLCVVLRLCAKPCKVKQWAKKDSNPCEIPEEFAHSETGVTKCVTLSSDSVAELCADVDLAKVAASWATLPATIKISIIAMVRAAERE